MAKGWCDARAEAASEAQGDQESDAKRRGDGDEERERGTEMQAFS